MLPRSCSLMKIYDFIYDKLNRKNKEKKPRPHAPAPEHEAPRERLGEDKEEKKNDRGVIIIQLKDMEEK